MRSLSQLQEALLYWFDLYPSTQEYWLGLGQKLFVFGVLVIASAIVGHYTPFLVRTIICRLAQRPIVEAYKTLIVPLRGLLKFIGTLILVALSSLVLQDYPAFYRFLRFFLDLTLAVSLGWFASRFFRQYVRTYGISLARRFGRDVDELLLAIETLANVAIGFIAIVAFAQSQSINLVGLLASVGLGGLAIAFAAQKTLEQLLGTVVLYLDRPYVPGEYIRFWNYPAFERGILAKVESIGLRSTKVRSVARGTLIVLPNSLMANLEIENVTRSKKVMVLLLFDLKKFSTRKNVPWSSNSCAIRRFQFLGSIRRARALLFLTLKSDRTRPRLAGIGVAARVFLSLFWGQAKIPWSYASAC